MPVTPESSDVRERARAAVAGSGRPQREVARNIGLDETKLSKALRGTRRFTPTELIKLAGVTGVTVDWLLGSEDQGQLTVAAPPPQAMPTVHRERSENAKKRRDIVEAAWELIAENGYSAVRIADIAAACGTSSATVHYYFRSKREIFDEALRYSVKLAFDRQVAVLHSIADPVERLIGLVDLQLPRDVVLVREWSIWLQVWGQVAVGASGKENHRQGYGRWSQAVRDAIIAGQQTGQIVDGPSDELATLLTAVMDGLGIKVLTGMLDVAAMRARLLDFVERSLLRDPDRGRHNTDINEGSPT